LDNKLRDFAFRKGRSKGDLIRELKQDSLTRMNEPVLKKRDSLSSDKQKAPTRGSVQPQNSISDAA
jgi:hypothetical protein